MTRVWPEQLAPRLVPLFLLLACQGETTTPTAEPVSAGRISAVVTDNVVATVSVAPDSQMVFVNDQFKATVEPRNAGGELLERTAKWTVSDKRIARTVGASGRTMTFKAVRTGSTTFKATVDGVSGSAKVVVRGTSGASVVVTPSSVTLAPGETAQFVATGITGTGETAGVNVTWTATGGSINGNGVLTAGSTSGTFRVIGTAKFGAADTSVVAIVAGADPLAAVILVPASAAVTTGGTVQFAAYGRTAGGDSVAVGVSYSATGGTIGGNGLYTAGQTAGTYRVIAAEPSGLADTAQVVVSEPPASAARVTLLPDIAASRPGEKTKFAATVWNDAGEPVSDPVSYDATCGSVTSLGIFTAPESGNCTVTASANGKSDATEVVLLPSVPGQGVPFGVYDLWATVPTSTRSPGGAAFTGSHDYVAPSDMVAHIGAARARGVRLVMAMTGGSHDNYKTDGVFDQAKWEAAVDAFNTPAILDAIAQGVADGTIIGNSVMDEPQQSGTTTKDWGPPGTMTKARVDELCSYVKNLFPTLPAGVFHDHNVFEPDSSYRVCEFIVTQYAARKGSLTSWRDAGLALAERDGISIIFSLNLLDGGPQDKTGAWDCPGTGGLGTREPNCRMTPQEVSDGGKLLGPAGCALLSWRWDSDFMAVPENQAAFSDVALTLAPLPRRPCVRQ